MTLWLRCLSIQSAPLFVVAVTVICLSCGRTKTAEEHLATLGAASGKAGNSYLSREETEAIAFLSRTRDRRAVPLLLSIVKASRPTASRHAVYALGVIGDPGSVRALGDVLQHAPVPGNYNDKEIQEAIGQALQKAGDPAVVPMVIGFLERIPEPRKAPVEVIRVLGAYPDERSIKPLVRLVRGIENTDMAGEVFRALGAIGEPALPEVLRLLDAVWTRDQYHHILGGKVGANFSIALARMGPRAKTQAVEWLQPAQRKNYDEVGAATIIRTKDDSLLPDLRQWLAVQRFDRQVEREVLASSSWASLADVLVDLVATGPVQSASQASQWLGYMGKVAIPKLKPLLGSSNPPVCEAAGRALADMTEYYKPTDLSELEERTIAEAREILDDTRFERDIHIVIGGYPHYLRRIGPPLTPVYRDRDKAVVNLFVQAIDTDFEGFAPAARGLTGSKCNQKSLNDRAFTRAVTEWHVRHSGHIVCVER